MCPCSESNCVILIDLACGRGSSRPNLRCWSNGKVVADSEARGRPLRSEGEAIQRIGHKFFVGSWGLYSILLTVGSFMRGLGSYFTGNCSGAPDRLSAPLLRWNKYLNQDSWCRRYATALVPDWLFVFLWWNQACGKAGIFVFVNIVRWQTMRYTDIDIFC